MVEFLMDYEQIRLMDLQAIMDDRKEANRLIRRLLYHRALERTGSSYYRKTEPFIEYLQNRLNHGISDAPIRETGGDKGKEMEIPF